MRMIGHRTVIRQPSDQRMDGVGDWTHDPHAVRIMQVSGMDVCHGGLSAPAASVLETLLEQQGAIIDVERTVTDCLAKLELRKLEELSARIQRDLSVATPAEADRLIAEKQANKNEMTRLSDSTTPA